MAYVIDQNTSPEEIKRRRKLADAMIARGQSAKPVGSWTQGAARVASTLAGLTNRDRASEMEQQARSQAADQFSSAISGAFSGMDGYTGGQASVPSTSDTDAPEVSGSYSERLASAESSGNDTARNPRSTATGRYQFTEGTWNDLSRRHASLGLTPDGRTDPEQQERAMQAFTKDNTAILQEQGLEPSNTNLYAMHFLGAGDGPKVLTADDNVPLASVVQPESIDANPMLRNMTVGDFKQWAGTKMGGAQGMATPDQTSPSTADTPAMRVAQATADAPQFQSRQPMQAQTAQAQPPQAQPQQQAGAGLQQLIQAAQNPYLSDAQQTVLGALIQQRMKAMQPKDPIKVGNTLVDPNSYEPLYSEPDDPSAMEAKIREIQNAYGVDRQTASGIATGVTSIKTNPVTGNQELVNSVTGEARMLDYARPGETPQAGTQQPGQPDMAQPGQEGAPGVNQQVAQATQETGNTLWNSVEGVPGVEGFFTELYGRTFGQLPGAELGQEVEDAIDNRQFYRLAQNDLIRSLSINPKFPVAEMNRIKQETDIEPNIWDSQDAIRTRMTRLDSFLHNRLENERRAAQDRTLPAETRQNAAAAAKDIENFLGILGVPQDAQAQQGQQGGAPEPGTIEDGYRFMGGDPGDPNSWQQVQ